MFMNRVRGVGHHAWVRKHESGGGRGGAEGSEELLRSLRSRTLRSEPKVPISCHTGQ